MKNSFFTISLLISIFLVISCTQHTKTQKAQNGEPDRTVLPLKEPTPPTYTELDVRNATPPPAFKVEAPEGAPNVVIVLIDDLGFAGTSKFGGPVETPTFDRMASEGVYYNNFHTTAVCSPTRAALKSGRNHHENNMGSIVETGTSFPGNTGSIPQEVAPVAEMLRLNGYSTAAFGKWHELAAWETNASGPYTRWPTGPNGGFDKFYGFLGGETNQWAPFIYDGTHPVELPEDPEYHFLEDMTDQAISWMKFQQALRPDKPFFVYYAPGATHAPHHVPKKYIEKHKGEFEEGWDKMREEILKRQIATEISPEGTQLTEKPSAIPNWDDLTDDEKTLFKHQAEVFAAYIDMMDYEVGRLVGAIEDINELDNTLIFFVYGDNGTSAEGGRNGMFSEMTYFNGVHEKVEDMIKRMDKWGGPETYPHMAAGWAVMFDTPYKWTKQMGSDYGGTKVGMTVHWPKGIKSKGELRQQFHHVIDVAPTILEVAGIPEPTEVNGVKQVPMSGTSMLYSFNDGAAEDQHTQQYFEMFGNRAMYKDGWLARTIHRAPWEMEPRRPLADDIWELYNVNEDFSLSNDLSKEHPEKLKELQDLFMKEAEKYHVLPIDDRLMVRLLAEKVGRPDLMAGRTSLTLAEGMTGMTENTFINIKNKSKTITAEVEVGNDGGNGIILCQGGRFGGWALYVKDGKPAYDYNFIGLQRFTIASNKKLPVGKSTIKFVFDYDGGGMGKGGNATLYVNNEKMGEGRIDHTQAIVFSADETADVGIDLATPVVETIGSEKKSAFTGHIPNVTVEVKEVK